MPITLEVVDERADADTLEYVFSYFTEIDAQFSPFKPVSELSRINRSEIAERAWSGNMKEVFALAEKTKRETDGYFDMKTPDGTLDPSGVVKGWAIQKAADLLSCMGYEHFYVDAGGDIQTRGKNARGESWSVGIRNPFDRREIVKVIYPHGKGVATSGTYVRGQHIYDPHRPGAPLFDAVSLTVIGPDVCEADRFATAAFAMGKDGIMFLERLPGFEGFLIDRHGMATMTSGFERYTKP